MEDGTTLGRAETGEPHTVVTFPEPVRPGAQNAPQSTNHYSSPSSWIVATKDVLKRQDKDLEMLLNDFMIKF